tara:strand:- start:56 stop:172 length:117 start_codon:yes stop_codon:yes gene_type:complete
MGYIFIYKNLNITFKLLAVGSIKTQLQVAGQKGKNYMN